MKVSQIQKLVKASVLSGQVNENMEVFKACGADLMSDVLRFAKEDVILITGLTNIHTLRTAEMANIQFVLFVRDKEPPAEVIDEAQEAGLTILKTNLPMYETCGILYASGLGKVEG